MILEALVFSYSDLPQTLFTLFQVAVIAALLVLLVQKEALRAAGGDRTNTFAKKLNRGIVPLFVIFCGIIGVRVIDFIH
jgi:hypothetical protein